MKIEEVLRTIPPKLVLDHYWEVFDLIAWRLKAAQPERREQFNLEDVTGYFSKELQEIDNPIVKRSYFRALICSKALLDKLVSLGLLVKENGMLRKSNEYSKIYRVLKFGIRSSCRRLVAWAVYYLYHKGITKFSTGELLSELSYSDEEYRAELPYLYVRKNGVWTRLLEKRGNTWILIAEPYYPTKPLLLLDISYRLSLAISELAKSKREFSEWEILTKLREMEARSLERTLKRLKMRRDDGRWIIDEQTVANIRKLLLEAELPMTWPFYGVLIVKSSYFKLLGSQSRTLYGDVPNSITSEFLDRLEAACKQYENDPDEMIKQAKSLVEEYNKVLERELGPWLKLNIRKAAFLDRSFGVKVSLEWEEFFSFLEEFSRKEIPLHEKYRYILFCRAPSLTLVMRDDMERTQAAVKEMVKEDMDRIHEILIDFTSFLEHVKRKLYKIAQRRRTVPLEPSVLQYLPEMISTLRALTFLVENGTIPACYRELRKVLENLAWMVLDDILFFKAVSMSGRRGRDIPISPYTLVTKEWYEWSVQRGLTLRHLGELKRSIKSLVKTIHALGMTKGYAWKEKDIEEAIFGNLSVSLYLLLVGKEVEIPKKLEGLVPIYKKELLAPLIEENLRYIIKSLKGKRLSDSDEYLITEITETTLKETPKEVIAPYPSNEFVLGFVDKIFHSKLLKKYKEYSHFVHSYFTSWHIFPFSSVLEFKVFKYELETFSQMVHDLIKNYVNMLFG